MDELEPPKKSVELQDAGAHELESDMDDHFSDASEGRKMSTDRSDATSPVPLTRVERVDDKPSHGEVPGTPAYSMRTQDAVPDEVEVVPEGTRSRSTSHLSAADRPSTPRSPGGTPIPKTVVEKVDPDVPSHGDVPGTAAYEMRQADAIPDIVLKAPEPPTKTPSAGSPTASNRSETLDDEAADPSDNEVEEVETAPKPDEAGAPEEPGQEADMDDNEEFGDDFDDFEEGEAGDDDFGDFDDGFQQPEDQSGAVLEPPVVDSAPALPIPAFEDLDDKNDVLRASQPFIEELFPAHFASTPEETQSADINPSLLSERSLSLWAQLVAPPPLQPPDWVRSRIRRLFLVSLGVPVDLDEILPASKQKKLILPSISIPGDRSPRPSSDNRNGALDRVKKEGGNNSTTSVDSSSSKVDRKRRGPPPPPELDLSSTAMLCSTTDAALNNLTDEELLAHVERLEALRRRADEVLLYWVKRKESAMGDKEAFEAVIANLVEHAKKVRK
ncbi:hypothetical protein K490DRAFT_62293 [Saccharata proteae CBS 121410]|uniref:Uncharacterized protein n=1 Tax=Saccharata proteae CBS 121410 TaxID=1314787 RepID=A0A9P4I2G3_9PEZI|nr:hypothetical protein K490DRAFT_62293 [Saccharata proteae CBS 121410]